jgi:hypothetical protein
MGLHLSNSTYQSLEAEPIPDLPVIVIDGG